MKSNVIVFYSGVLFLLVFCTSLFGQNLYVKVSGGYGIGNHKSDFTVSEMYNTYVYVDSVISDTKWTLKRNSFGQGVQGELTVGTFLNPILGFELTGFYGKSKKLTIESNEYNSDKAGFFVDYYLRNNFIANSFGFKPTMILRSKGKKIKAYVKAGAIFAFAAITVEKEFRYYTNIPGYYPTWDQTSKFEYKRGLNLGLTSSIGMEIILGSDVCLFAEMCYNNLVYRPKSGEYTEFKERGEDMLGELTVQEKEIEFVDSYMEALSEVSPL